MQTFRKEQGASWWWIQLKVERALNVRKTEMSLKKVKGLILTLIILIPVLISLGIIFGIFWKGV